MSLRQQRLYNLNTSNGCCWVLCESDFWSVVWALSPALNEAEAVVMNTANLQLEGLYVVLATLLDAMCEKGFFQREEIEDLLKRAESALSADPDRPTEMRGANVDAICFSARFLMQAMQGASEGRDHSFARLASRVGQAKREA
jgi:hypothetical protein